MKEDDSIIPTGWHTVAPNLPVDTSRATCVDFLSSPGGFSEKKNIQKRWEDFRLKSFGGV